MLILFDSTKRHKNDDYSTRANELTSNAANAYRLNLIRHPFVFDLVFEITNSLFSFPNGISEKENKYVQLNL